MSNVKLGQRSLDRLSGVNSSLVAVLKKACESMPFDITVLEGVRSYERQQELLKQGATKVSVSRHMSGNAIDIAPYPIDWNDTERFKIVAHHMFAAAKELGIVIRWGGNWSRQDETVKPTSSFVDMPHFELPA
ncbi:L-alanyl-D-glutamate peptidase [Escherichia phage vB_EcoM_4HA13]|uniref:L-alanyl-D-glutamate peptidase n=1 Tax=Escherichia phage vB_EcoM_4HA13 TaxID=2601675 RepID=A0A7D0NEJ1_9CAUD|nr:endolysin [Escherichia phage vB_EcoM_4HA13]QEM42992.1 L-alanyl-D-glutamate peptidase [Escherichia phage vB_EcoM_4HA13]